MTLLPDLTGAAISGTPDALPPSDVVRAALAALSDDIPAEQRPATTLLGVAGAVAVARRALLPSRDPSTLPPAPAPAPADDTPTLGPAATVRARDILAVREHALLDEWLRHARVSGRVLPSELVPAALDLAAATSRYAVRHGLLAVLGIRGRWYASLDDATRHLVVDVPRTPDGTLDLDALAQTPAWTDGTLATRGRWFEILRATDADAARSLLTRDRDTIGAALLARCTELLAVGLTLADEPLAAHAAAHTSRPVVEAGQRLLQQLPGSAARLGVAAALGDAVTVTRGRLLARNRLTVTTDLAPDALEAAVAATPLARWTASGLTPDELVGLAHTAGEAAAPVLEGWHAATYVERDVAWADALLAAAGRSPHGWLLMTASPGARDAALERAARTVLADGVNIWPLRSTLEDREVAVSADACARILAILVPAAATIDSRRLRDVIDPLALRVEPTAHVRDLFTAAAAQIDATDDLLPDLQAVLHRGAATVQDRLTLAEELT